MRHPNGDHRPHGFHRDPERGVILGVCAGIAEHFDWPLWLTRLGALALGWFMPVATIAAYLVAALLMPERPLRYCGRDDETTFWRSGHRRS